MRSTAALLALLLLAAVACGRSGPSPAAPTKQGPANAGEDDAPSASADEVAAAVAAAKKFWEGIIAHDDRALDAVVGFPFMWDARCRLFPGRAEMDAHLKAQEQPPNVHVADARPIPSSDAPEELHEAFDNLSALDGCQPDMTELQAEAGRLHRIYVLVDLVAGETKIPTVTRVSRISGEAGTGWRVTGIDN